MKTQWSLETNEPTSFNSLDEYDRLMGEQRRQSQAWRMRSLICTAINLVLVIGIVISFSRNRPVPVFIMENELGELKYLGELSTSYGGGRITGKMIEAQVRTFFVNMYTIPLDSDVMRNSMSWNYAMMTSDAAAKFTGWLREDKPFELFGMETRSVSIDTVLSLSSNSYQVDFSVTSVLINGGGKKTDRKRAVVTTGLFEPDQKNIFMNPAGIYITNYDVTDLSRKTGEQL